MPEPIQFTRPLPPPPAPGPAPEAPPAGAPSMSVVITTPPLSDLALGCASKVDAVLIPMLAVAPNPLIAALIGFKAGSELRECFDERTAETSLRAAVKECLDAGGTPLGLVENVLTCEVGQR
jgi:hypothetical protein